MIAIPFFVLLVILSRPIHSPILASIFIGVGIFIRIWAGGYIGQRARQNHFSAHYMITNGPYRFLKHPLYCGNLLLVVGVILLFNPPPWFAILLIILFILEYSIIAFSEFHHLKKLPKKRVKFKLTNTRGEISTVIILMIIYLVYVVRSLFIS